MCGDHCVFLQFAAHVADLATHVRNTRLALLQHLHKQAFVAVQAICQPLPEPVSIEAKQDMNMIAEVSLGRRRLAEATVSCRGRLELLHQKHRSARQTQFPAVSLSPNNHSPWYTRRVRVLSQTAPSGAPSVLLFRGLCALTSAGQRQQQTADGPYSPLYIHHQYMYDDAWSHICAIAVILHTRHATRDRQSPTLQLSCWTDAAWRNRTWKRLRSSFENAWCYTR